MATANAPRWSEALTLVSKTRAPDNIYQALQAQLTAEEQVNLTLLIVAINGWNRIQVGFRAVLLVESGRRADDGNLQARRISRATRTSCAISAAKPFTDPPGNAPVESPHRHC
jgi:hypothetical protein